MTNRQKVAITGIGVVSPAGSDIDTFWQRIVTGRTAIGPITNIPTERLSCRVAAEVKDFVADDHFGRRSLGMDRFAQFAVVAARSAIADAGLGKVDFDKQNVPVVLGTGVGGLNTLDDGFQELYGKNATRLHPLTIPRLMVNAAASHVSMDLGLRGEVYAIASACASGTHAIGRAFRLVRSGEEDIVITGGTEACLTVGTLKGWEALRVMSSDMCRPFSANRNGMILGEGAAILVLESEQRARQRGASIYAMIEGYGATADAGDLTSPSVEGTSRAMMLALQDAGLSPSDIDYVNAHGTGTLLNDATETAAIRFAFGSAADRLLVSSSKAVLGHGLGVAGAWEAVITALALHNGVAPPTAGWESSDPQCDLDCVPNTAREVPLRAALSNSFAFGGLNAVLALTRST